MKLKITQNNLQNLLKAGLFICLVACIVHLYPTADNRFKYNFEIGKPWRYELMTASFDFPIYKSNEQLRTEQAEALRNFTPYFTQNKRIGTEQLQQFKHLLPSTDLMASATTRYLTEQFENIYAAGVVPADQMERLAKENYTKVILVDEKRLTNTVPVSSLYTPKTAYATIVENAPTYAQELLKNSDLNRYLKENLVYDSITSEGARAECLKGVSLTQGMVQKGERIIDRGEIVTEHAFLVLSSLRTAYGEKQINTHRSALALVGEVLFATLFILLFFLYLYLFRPRIFAQWSNILFMGLLILLMVASASVLLKYTNLGLSVVPFALLPIVVRVFFDSRTALFAHWTTIMIVSLMAPAPFEFIVVQVAAGMAAVSSLKDLTQRAQLAQTALLIFAVYSVLYLALILVSEGNLSSLDGWQFLYFGVNALILLSAYGFIYLFEKIFGLMSSITLVELTNVNSDLMLKFAEVAPGTFQHSLQVSNLATEAAKKINANSLLVRTGALYHDIGKMMHPQLFTENQQGGINPLLNMELEDAAKAVIDHVADGVKLAHKEGLPEMIVNFVRTHHGTSRTKFFYNTFRNRYPDRTPNEAAFTYPGPRPNTKETAILMMADAVEACSRSLSAYTEESIDQMVEKIVDGQIADGQFKETPISFRDVEEVKMVFKEKIKNIYHHRIAYPEVQHAEASK